MSEVEQEEQSSQGIPLPIDLHVPDYSDEEELEWDNLFAQPHVQAGLDRLEEEAMRQFQEGKTVEGGFAIE